MARSPTSSPRWHFDSVIVDTATFEVLVNGTPQSLEPKSFRLLQFLIENRDRVVSKDEIFQAVWTGTFVSDNALTRAVAQIRKAIGDDPKQPRYIETLPTVGYRFVAALTESAGAPPAVSSPAPVVENATRRVPVIVLKGAAAIASVAAIGIAGWLWTHRPIQPEARTTAAFLPVQFSSSAGLDMGASFSPDGMLVAYASDKPGSLEIFVKSFDSSARELQLTSDGGQNLAPSFSPDGRWIAFASARRRGIFRVPAIGGTVQRLTDFGVQPVWAPDARTIVFRSSGSASLSTTDYYWPAESSLWMVPAAGGEPIQIAGKDGPIEGGQSFPSFSPDGTEIRFVNNYKAEASIWTYRIADRTLRKLFASTTFPYSNATFAPDGTRMWFVSWELNGNIGIWQLALDPATLMPRGEPEVVFPSAGAVPRDLALSADGKRLAFTAVLSTSEVLAHQIAGDAPPISLTKETAYRYGLVRSSPDGSRVLYTAFPRNGLSRVWVAMADGTKPLAVGPADAAQFYGGMSADNSRVLFVEKRGSELRLVTQRLADGASQQLSALPPGAAQVACSRDCTRVAFHDVLDDRRKVYVQESGAGTRHVIASGPEDVGFPRFSRDDQWISLEITHRPRGGDDIAVMPAGGGPIQVILKSDESSFAAGWMPDNDRVLFAGFRDGAWNIYTVSRTTGRAERLTSYVSLRTYVRYPDWIAGDRVAFEFNETKGNIFIADLLR